MKPTLKSTVFFIAIYFLNWFVTIAQVPLDLSDLQNEAIEWLQDYIRINTMNPPGNEIAGAEFLASIFKAEGIKYEIAESAPGRGNIWAMLEGGNEPGLALLHHIDVVPADKKFWRDDPLSGQLKDGYIYGRGALDTKSSGILHLAAFIALHRSGISLKRNILFIATADEEAGGFYGAGWLIKNRPELFKDVGYLLNEGGGGTELNGHVEFGVEVTQKVPYWLRLSVTGDAGHGFRPLVSYASIELIAALERLRLHEFAPRIIPVVDNYFKGIADTHPEPWSSHFKNISSAIGSKEIDKKIQAYSPSLHALTRNTYSITRFQGSSKINVISSEAWAELDCRLLPDQDPEEWLTEIEEILGENVEVEVLMGFTPAISTTDTDLYRIIEEVTIEGFPDATILPLLQGGFTDSHFFRDMGIVCYGYVPTATPMEDKGGVHGNNERITEQNLRQGVELTIKLLERFATNDKVLRD